MRITTRLALGFGLVIGFLIVMAITGVLQLGQANRNVEQFASLRVVKLIATARSTEAVLQDSRLMRDVLILDDDKEIKETLLAVQNGKQQRQNVLDHLGTSAASGKEKKLLDDMIDAGAKYNPHEDEFLKTAGKGDYSTAKAVMLERLRPAQLNYLQAIKRFSDYQVEQSAREAGEAEQTHRKTTRFLSGLAALAVLCGAMAA